MFSQPLCGLTRQRLCVCYRSTYKAVALNARQQQQQRAEKKGPTFAIAISNVTIPVGREAVLSCVVEDLSNYKIAWLQVNTQTILTIANHVITKNHRIGVTHSDHRTWYLHIKDVRESDAGDYMCQINTDPMKSQIVYLEVVVPPDILDYPTSTDMVVREGSNVTLKCAATGSPTPNITWRREGSELITLANDQGVTHVEGPMLNITRVNRLHMGPYLCIASNGVPPTVSKRIMLIVHFPPMIMVQDQLVGAQEGQELTMECMSEAYPKSINYWTRENDDEIIANSEKYDPVLINNVYKVQMKLTIHSVSKSDYGAYKCIANNSLGSTDGSIKLYHIPTPSTTPTTTTTTIATTVRTTSTTPIPYRTERKQRTRQKIMSTAAPRINDLAVFSKATINKEESRQHKGKNNEDFNSGAKINSNSGKKNSNSKNSNHERLEVQRDKTAQSRSSIPASHASVSTLEYSKKNLFVVVLCLLIVITEKLTQT
uniref:Ig-like domain-containing protein n=1 Tax=Trichogramma kaykai TaxID=54128 RepID=A0ABD2WIX5_9HYME